MTIACEELETAAEEHRAAIAAARENPEDGEAQATRDETRARFLALCDEHLPECKACRKRMSSNPVAEFFGDIWLEVEVFVEMFWKPGLAVLVVVGIIGLVFWGTASEASGSFESSGGELGDWSLTLDDCDSGERDGFHGVWLLAGDDPEQRLQLVKSPSRGYLVRVPLPGTCDEEGACKALVLTPSSCEKLEAKVRRDSGRAQTNDIYHLEGHLRLDCKLKKGGHISGEAVFEDCH